MPDVSQPTPAPAASKVGNVRSSKNRLSAPRAGGTIALALFCVVVAAAVRWAIQLYFGENLLTFATFYPAVLLAALYGGLRAGALTLVLSAIVAVYFFAPPIFSLALTTGVDVVNVSLFIISCAAILAGVHAYRRKTDALFDKGEEFETLADSIPVLCWMAEAGGKTYWRNGGWDAYPSAPSDANRLWTLQFQHDAEADKKWADCLRTGEAFEAQLPLRRADGTQREFLTRVVAIKDPSGVIQRWVGTATDVDELKNTVAREKLLAAEVDHRAKNMLGVVQAVVQLTPIKDAEALKSSLLGRIQLLGRVQNLLSESGWRPVPIKSLFEEELAAFAPSVEQLVIDGPPLAAKPEALQTLGLIIHELASNALQYGALSSPSGRVEVRWKQIADEVALTWRERGGPPLEKMPGQTGFGTSVIDRSVKDALRGSATFNWESEGLSCEIRLPSTFFQTETWSSQSRPKSDQPSNVEEVGPGRLLIVEDEPLIAMDLEEIFTGAGFEVVGTASSIVEAFEKIRTCRPEIVTLDLNLLGTRSYPVADYLGDEGIPFVFCTGYSGTERFPDQHKHVPVLAKPVHPIEAVKTLRTLLGASRKSLRTKVEAA